MRRLEGLQVGKLKVEGWKAEGWKVGKLYASPERSGRSVVA